MTILWILLGVVIGAVVVAYQQIGSDCFGNCNQGRNCTCRGRS